MDVIDFQKRAGDASPLPLPSSCAPVHKFSFVKSKTSNNPKPILCNYFEHFQVGLYLLDTFYICQKLGQISLKSHLELL